MNVIIMYVFLLSGQWISYPYGEDPLMAKVETLDDCDREAKLLRERRGDVTSYVCYGGGKDPKHLFLPPYDWPILVYPIDASVAPIAPSEADEDDEHHAD